MVIEVASCFEPLQLVFPFFRGGGGGYRQRAAGRGGGCAPSSWLQEGAPPLPWPQTPNSMGSRLPVGSFPAGFSHFPLRSCCQSSCGRSDGRVRGLATNSPSTASSHYYTVISLEMKLCYESNPRNRTAFERGTFSLRFKHSPKIISSVHLLCKSAWLVRFLVAVETRKLKARVRYAWKGHENKIQVCL